MHTEIHTIPCLQDNYAYIIHNHKRNETFLIDAPESFPIIKKIEEKNWKLNKIVFTHHHSDHIMGTNELVKKYKDINPNIDIKLAGLVPTNAQFAKSAQDDGSTLTPLMIVATLLAVAILLRAAVGLSLIHI